AFGGFGLRDLSLAGLGEYRLDGLVAEVDAVALSLGEFRLADVGFPGPEAILTAIEAMAAGDTPRVNTLVPRLGLLRFADIA
ncbi:hypothetical protein J8J40_32990, partial [Mycobacterium tuberculosis]|nr:hypothetical protein [Mycobacterium tuberculosis]